MKKFFISSDSHRHK